MHNFLPVLALVFNAFVWGVSWWPFRQLHGAGVHPLWATALVFTLAVVGLLLARPGVFTRTRAYPALWLLALSSGLTNVAFNWAVTVGDVVRVVLLFYLMPAWSVLLAWRVLGERPTRTAVLRLVMAFAGVVLCDGACRHIAAAPGGPPVGGRPAGPGRGLLLRADQRHPAPPAPRAQRIPHAGHVWRRRTHGHGQRLRGLAGGLCARRCPLWPWAGSWSRYCWPRPFY